MRKAQGSTSASSRLTAEHERALSKLDKEIRASAEKHLLSDTKEICLIGFFFQPIHAHRRNIEVP